MFLFIYRFFIFFDNSQILCYFLKKDFKFDLNLNSFRIKTNKEFSKSIRLLRGDFKKFYRKFNNLCFNSGIYF